MRARPSRLRHRGAGFIRRSISRPRRATRTPFDSSRMRFRPAPRSGGRGTVPAVPTGPSRRRRCMPHSRRRNAGSRSPSTRTAARAAGARGTSSSRPLPGALGWRRSSPARPSDPPIAIPCRLPSTSRARSSARVSCCAAVFREPEKAKENFQEFVKQGLEVADKTQLWAPPPQQGR